MTAFIEHHYQGSCPDVNQPDARDASCLACQALTESPRTIHDMPITVSQIEARMLELDNLLKAGHYDYAVAAEASVRARRKREVAIAEAFRNVAGSPTERKQLAIAEVGNLGVDDEAVYARLAADMEVIQHRIITGAALLKSAKS